MNNKGFTLIELMIVVVIIGILAAIAIPNFISMQKRAKEASVKANMHTIQLACEDFSTQADGFYPISLAQTVSAANTNVVGNNNAIADEEPAIGALGANALLPTSIKNPIVAANNTAQTAHPAAVWAAALVGSCNTDFMDNVGGAAAGSPSNGVSYLISGYGQDAILSLTLTSGQ